MGAEMIDPDEAYDREREDRAMEISKSQAKRLAIQRRDPDDAFDEAIDGLAELAHEQGECGPFCPYCEDDDEE